MAQIQLLDAVALLEDLPQQRLQRGQVGTIVGILAPSVYEVEFSDDAGKTYAMAALRAEQIMALRYEPARTGS